MLGFIFGTVCMIGLFVVLRRTLSPFSRRFRAFGGRHMGFRSPFWACAPRSSHLIDQILDELRTSPAQEKAVRQALERLHEAAHEAHGNIRNARAASADAMRADQLDPSTMSEALAQSQLAYDRMRDATLDSLTAIHSALEPEQRKRLAELITAGPSWHVHGGPYRTWPAHA